MKTRTKALLLALCAIALVAASVLGTLAYLTSTDDAVKNTFTLGDVDIVLDEGAALAIDEEDNPYENKNDASLDRVISRQYNLVPAQDYEKDPVVWLEADSEDSFVYVAVKNEIAALENDVNNDSTSGVDATGRDIAAAYKTVAEQLAANGWVELKNGEETVKVGEDNGYTVYTRAAGKLGADTNNETVNAEGKYDANSTTELGKTVHPDDAATGDNTYNSTEYYKLPVFEGFSIEETLDNEYFANIADTDGDGVIDADITVKAFAIQAVGFTDAYSAWAASGFANDTALVK